jgi:amino acid transporter
MNSPDSRSRSGRLRDVVLGQPRDVKDPEIFHHVSLVAFLAWVGLGADGLSSSAYGPDQAYRTLGSHSHLAIALVAMTAVTISIISIAYSDVIQHFPGGGGGYLVATKLLGNKAGVVSGCALLVDYVLTISTSVASGCDALWSFLPPHLVHLKLTAEIVVLILLIVLNLRGVRESVTILAPIFLFFILTHVILIFWAIASHFTQLPTIFHQASLDFHGSVKALGFAPIAFLLLRAYSMGGGTYTGIEAVSNGVTMLREPRVKTGKRTMLLMAASLAFTAGGILFAYMLVDVHPDGAKTLNAILLERLFNGWSLGGLHIGPTFVIASLAAEAALLFVAAQTGFLDGPRILSNMAVDSWMPHRFAQLSSRLVTQNGVFVMGFAAMATLLYTRGEITTLLVMYSINVFLTFSLTELGMVRHWIQDRHKEPQWKLKLAIHGTGLVLCASILCVTIYEKFLQGGWITLLCTGATIGLCFLIRRHYRRTRGALGRLDSELTSLPLSNRHEPPPPVDPKEPTAVITVSGFSGFGLHELLSINQIFPRHFKNFVFVSVAVVDSGNFKGEGAVAELEEETRTSLEKYVEWCRSHGLRAAWRMSTGTEAVGALDLLCREVAQEFPRAVFFGGKLVFRVERWYHRLLHNETGYALQRRLQFAGLPTIILPIRVLEGRSE